MRVFADTSGLFAALVGNDVMHEKAGRIFRRLIERGDEIHTSSYVVVETVSLLHARVGLPAVAGFRGAIEPLLEVAWIDADLHERAMVRLLDAGSKRASLVDHSSFEAMADLGLESVFGFDVHFEEAGFTLIG